MPRYVIHARCLNFGCGNIYKWSVDAENEAAVAKMPNKPCPKCKPKKSKRKKANVKRRDTYETATPPIAHSGLDGVIEEQRAPGINFNGPAVQAIEETANIVMKDYGLTDLKTGTRQGESMAPDLTPKQRAMASNFWGGKKGGALVDPRVGKQMVQSAMAGQFLADTEANRGRSATETNYAGDVIKDLHARRAKPKVTIIGQSDGKE